MNIIKAGVRRIGPAVVGLTLVFSSVGAAETYEIGTDLQSAAFWTSDPVLFVKKHQTGGFKFTADDRLAADSRLEGGVACFGLPVYESRVAFAMEGGIARVELMLFNRGGLERVREVELDDGKKIRQRSRNEKTVTREEFFAILKGVQAKLTAKGRKAPQPVNERTRAASVHQRVQTWPRTDIGTRATLRWNYSQEGKKVETFQPGFIRLAIDGPTSVTPTAGKPGAAQVAKGAKKITENVVRDPRGDVFIDNVPMVDQGMKGYCAVSTAERVMRYYGLDVDEHEIAEAAGTSAETGTSTRAMKEAVERIGKRYGLATMLLYGDFDDDVGARIANLNTEVSNYNKAAKKLRRSAITDAMYIRREGNTISYDVTAVDTAMDAEVLKEMKTNGAQKAKFTKFKQHVHQAVDAGLPLYWGVKLGVYPESDLPQAIGGHMRLIIGYNDKRGEIIYTDSWGKGHEFKHMPIGWAWTISRSLMAMKPVR